MKVKSLALLASLVMLEFMAGCASLGLAPAKTLSDRLAYGYATLASVQYAAANDITAGELGSEDGEAILRVGDQTRTLLDGAKALLETDPEGANTKLTLAVGLLTQLQAYLREHRK